jgi:hypothetical protein
MVMAFSLTMGVPLAFSWFGNEESPLDHALALAITFSSGLAIWLATRRYKRELQPRDGFLLVALVWSVLPAFATLPLLLHVPDMSFTDAYFETMSGITTTGATVMTGLDALPLSINVFRSLHRPAIHRARRRLTDAVYRKHHCVDRPVARHEVHHRICDQPARLVAQAALAHPMWNAALHQVQRHGLGTFSEEMQGHLGVSRRCAAEHRPDQSRIETLQQAHRLQRRPAQRAQRRRMRMCFEQPVMCGQCRFDLRVLRQHRDICGAKALGRLAFCQSVVVDTLLGHDACRFLRQRHSQLFRAGVATLAHRDASSE